MSNFVKNFERMANQTLSENGGIVFSHTGEGALLDLFALIGGMRHQSDNEIISKWKAAYNENPELAANLILYTRDAGRNGGLGERRIGRLLLKELAKLEPEKVKRNLQTIVDIGRWDDLFSLEGTPCEDAMWGFIKGRFIVDITLMKENKPISLLAKWSPSINTSSKESRRLANKFCKIAGISPRTYRKALSKLRAYLDVVERKMSAGEWSEIDYEAVPSLAMSRYTKAFNIHNPEAFGEYKNKLSKGETKVNASVITPSEICRKYIINGGNRAWNSGWYGNSNIESVAGILDEVDKAQWNSLPNYVEGGHDVVVCADISGSMSSPNYEPIAASVGLATYFAQRNVGAYKNFYMSFAGNPSFIKLEEDWDIEKCFSYVLSSAVSYNTNLDLCFKAIFNVAKESGETPSALVVVSDGEIDGYARSGQLDSIASKWAKKYAEVGLKSPKLISWNVAARNGTVLAPESDNVAYVSGYGAGPFGQLNKLINKSGYEAMVEILTQPQFCWK